MHTNFLLMKIDSSLIKCTYYFGGGSGPCGSPWQVLGCLSTSYSLPNSTTIRMMRSIDMDKYMEVSKLVKHEATRAL